MASSGIFELVYFTATAAGDVLAAVDVSDSTQAPQGSTKAITITNFFAAVPVPIAVTDATDATTTTTGSLKTAGGLGVAKAAFIGTSLNFGTVLKSVAALATPGAYAATASSLFASTVSGATLMGFGSTGDVTLKNRAGTDVIVVTANTTGVMMAGALQVSGGLSGLHDTTPAADNAYTLGSAGARWGDFRAALATIDSLIIKNTTSVVSPTSPNRTVTIIVNGVTLYFAAKTTND